MRNNFGQATSCCGTVRASCISLFVSAIGFVAAAVAGPTDSAIVAAMKLTEARNYSWKTLVSDDARTYDIIGQTERASDYSLVTMPMVSSVRRRVSRGTSAGENITTVMFRGDESFVIQTDDGWQKPGELASTSGRDSRGRSPGGYPPSGGGLPGGRRPSGRGGPGDTGTPAFSNLQKTLSRPHDEIGIIVAGATELKMDGDVLSGPLTETAAMLLLVHPGQNEINPLRASGSFRVWVQNGVLTKYETKLEGKLSIQTSAGVRDVNVHQTAMTTVTQIGTTTFEIPPEAKKKLGG